MFEHECELLISFLCLSYRGPGLLEMVIRITEEIRKKYQQSFIENPQLLAILLKEESTSFSFKQSESEIVNQAGDIVRFTKSCVGNALFFLRIYNLDLDRMQVIDHMMAFYEEIRSDDDPSADSEAILTYLRTKGGRE